MTLFAWFVVFSTIQWSFYCTDICVLSINPVHADGPERLLNVSARQIRAKVYSTSGRLIHSKALASSTSFILPFVCFLNQHFPF